MNSRTASRAVPWNATLNIKTASYGGFLIPRKRDKPTGRASGRGVWLGIEDSNLGIQIQSLLSYH